jgi:hypothetical protein
MSVHLSPPTPVPTSHLDPIDETLFRNVSIPLVRRVYPQLIANKITSVQPLQGPTGLVYYMRFKYANKYMKKYRWKWLKAGITEELIRKLNDVGMTENQQAYICRHRPDLIHLIKNLKKKLKIMYRNELNLSGIDI